MKNKFTFRRVYAGPEEMMKRGNNGTPPMTVVYGGPDMMKRPEPPEEQAAEDAAPPYPLNNAEPVPEENGNGAEKTGADQPGIFPDEPTPLPRSAPPDARRFAVTYAGPGAYMAHSAGQMPIGFVQVGQGCPAPGPGAGTVGKRKFCPMCGTPFAGDDRFCRECGAARERADK